MRRVGIVWRVVWAGLAVVVLGGQVSAQQSGLAATDWPAWRGPLGTGQATAGALPPATWGGESTRRWMAPIPGKGHGSPIVVGEDVIVATADLEAQVQMLVCLDRTSGNQRWTCDVHRMGLKVEGNQKASLASSTPACDGERLYINFLNDSAVTTSAVSRSGEVLWQTKISDYTVHQGYGSSPYLWGDLVIVTADNKGGGAIAALRRDSGEVVWKRERPEKPNYASPIVFELDGREQLIVIGCDLVTSLDPATGEVLWEIEGATTECVSTTVTDGKRIFTSGGYPKNHVAAVETDGSGTVTWENNVRVYVPSLLFRDGYLYTANDAGVAICWDSATGEEQWKGRLGGTFSASPVMVEDRLYAINEGGETFTWRASPKGFELLGSSRLGDEVFGTPAVSDGLLFVRVAVNEEEGRQEYVVCVGE